MVLTTRSVVLCVLVLVSLSAASCKPRTTPSDGRIGVVVSIEPLAWLVEQVGGERVEVMTLIRRGENHHTYQPTDEQAARAARSAVFFDNFVVKEDIRGFAALRNHGTLRLVDLRQGLTLRTMEAHGHEDHDHADHAHSHAHEQDKDPHTWLTPRLLKAQARTIAQALAQIDPGHADGYAARLADLDRRLDELDADLRTRLAPLKGTAFFVYHPAWGYFADEYGLEQVAVEAEGKEPTDRQLTELIELARGKRVGVVFVQPQIPGRGAEALARAIGGRVERLDPLERDVAANLRKAADALLAARR